MRARRSVACVPIGLHCFRPGAPLGRSARAPSAAFLDWLKTSFFQWRPPGIENDQRRIADTIEQRKGWGGVRAVSANASDRASKCAIDRGDVAESSEAYELSNVVETALARALVLAAEAKRWDVVMRIAEELGRQGSAPHSIPNTVVNRASTRS